MIAIRGLSKRFGHRLALHNVDLDIAPGEIVALLGPNGAGKSTLLRIIATLAKPTVGNLRVAGFQLPDQAISARAQIGYVGHQPLLYDDLSAEENLAFFARLYRISKAEARVTQLLKQFELDARRRDPLRTFSRGMQQRIAIARALLHKPRILLLDEPHSGLDSKSADLTDKLLKEQAKRGCTILMATHDLARVSNLAQRVEVLAAGRVVASLGRSQLRAKQLPALYNRALRRETHAA